VTLTRAASTSKGYEAVLDVDASTVIPQSISAELADMIDNVYFAANASECTAASQGLTVGQHVVFDADLLNYAYNLGLDTAAVLPKLTSEWQQLSFGLMRTCDPLLGWQMYWTVLSKSTVSMDSLVAPYAASYHSIQNDSDLCYPTATAKFAPGHHNFTEQGAGLLPMGKYMNMGPKLWMFSSQILSSSDFISAFVSGYGMTGLYTTFVLVVATFLRTYMVGLSERIIWEDMDDVSKLKNLVYDLYAAREAGFLKSEEKLYNILISIYRDPAMLKILSTENLLYPEDQADYEHYLCGAEQGIHGGKEKND